MEKMYVISWKAKYRDGAGKGKKLLDLERAEKLAEELNRDYPDFEHSVTPAQSPDLPALANSPNRMPAAPGLERLTPMDTPVEEEVPEAS